jgi:hypothetical protein
MWQRVLLCGALFFLGCGAASSHSGADGGSTDLANAHMGGECTVALDCDTGDPCNPGVCNPVTRKCEPKPKDCPSSACSTGKCVNGQCMNAPINEGGPCTSLAGDAWSCSQGTCSPPPSCYVGGGQQPPELFCSNDSWAWYDDRNDLTNHPLTQPTNLIDTYACGSGYTAPEIAYVVNPTADEDLTIDLKAQNPTTDLDLLILDGACSAKAPCVNPPNPGGAGLQGLTAGTGLERVTFHAVKGKTYYVVVDGKGTGAIDYFHLELLACGVCQPTPATTVACGMSVMGNTVMGKAALTSYACGAASPNLPGNEQAFWLSAATSQMVTAKVVSPSKPVTVLALPAGPTAPKAGRECLASGCMQQAASSGTSDVQITFPVEPYNSTEPNRYWVVVDTPTLGQDATFGLQISCN